MRWDDVESALVNEGRAARLPEWAASRSVIAIAGVGTTRAVIAQRIQGVPQSTVTVLTAVNFTAAHYDRPDWQII